MKVSTLSSLAIAVLFLASAHAQFPDILFSCPSRGCSARATFALPTPAPDPRNASDHAFPSHASSSYAPLSSDSTDSHKDSGKKYNENLPQHKKAVGIKWNWTEEFITYGDPNYQASLLYFFNMSFAFI